MGGQWFFDRLIFYSERKSIMKKNDNLLCSKCKTGMVDFLLDRRSDVCTYLACLKDGKCCMYAPLTSEYIRETEGK